MSSTHSGCILVIDADSNIRELLEVNLNSEGYSVRTFATPEDAGEIDPVDVRLCVRMPARKVW